MLGQGGGVKPDERSRSWRSSKTSDADRRRGTVVLSDGARVPVGNFHTVSWTEPDVSKESCRGRAFCRHDVRRTPSVAAYAPIRGPHVPPPTAPGLPAGRGVRRPRGPRGGAGRWPGGAGGGQQHLCAHRPVARVAERTSRWSSKRATAALHRWGSRRNRCPVLVMSRAATRSVRSFPSVLRSNRVGSATTPSVRPW